ncbi:hypothetical protein GCM10023191_062320 [Actinoallomurus oryzae]|uniref:Uncharacterized protein n=1 Tax=Actinoallomurus oryzae TaxID=502180 RepID=A0ABP8QP72_9ACTN
MVGRRAAVVLGALALLAPGTAQPAHAAPAPPAPRRTGLPYGLARSRIVGTPMRHARPLSTRSFSAAAPEVTIDVLDRSGKPPTTDEIDSVLFIPLDGGDWLSAEVRDGHAEAAVPAGAYAVSAYVMSTGANGETSTTLIYRSKVSVTRDTALTLDARTARPIRAAVDRADARTVGIAAVLTQRLGSRVETVALLDGPGNFVTPTGGDSELTFRLQAQLTKDGAATSPYLYAIGAARDGIPADPGLSVRTRDLAAVRTGYAGEGGPACVGTSAGVDWGTGLSVEGWTGQGPLPATRTEYLSPGLNWLRSEYVTGTDCGFAFDDTDVRSRTERYPGAGSYARRWSAAPAGPAAGSLHWQTGQEPALVVRMLSSQDAQSSIAPYAHMTGTSTLRDANGRVIATSDQPGSANDWTHPAPGKYTLTVDANRDAPWSDLATRQHVVWNLTVDDAARVALPVLRYATALDADGRARAGRNQTITVTPDGTGGTPALQVSYDDGERWTSTPLHRSGSGWTTQVRNPASGYVSLRGTVAGVVDQTVIRAYGVG